MKLDELLAEQSSKPVSRDTRPVAPKPVKTPRTPTRKDTAPIPAPKPTPFDSRAEVFEALQLLSGGKVRISSINGGKAKKKKGKR